MALALGALLIVGLVALCCWAGSGGETSGKAPDGTQYGGQQ